MGRLLGGALAPIVVLMAIGLLLRACNGGRLCPWDPVTRLEYCSAVPDYAAWSRAVRWEMEQRDRRR